jgi:gliding motility-associated-like protein
MKIRYFKNICKVIIVLLVVAFCQRAMAAKVPASLIKPLIGTGDTSKVKKPGRLEHVKKAKGEEKDEEKDKEKDKEKDQEDGVSDDIHERAHQEFLQRRDPKLNRVPVERLLTARKLRDQFLKTRLEKAKLTKPQGNVITPSGNTPGASPATISGLQWNERGPNNVGGRTRALMFDMNDAANGYKKVFAGGVDGGLWVTSDITATPVQWTKINDFFDNIAISCIAQDPVNPQEIYAGTGEGFDNIDAVQGLGVWKSSDGGVTWAQLPSSASYMCINAILVDRNSNVYLAGDQGNKMDGSPIAGFGVVQSIDGGATWTAVITSSEIGVDLQLAANGDVYASTGLGFAASNGHIYLSDFAVNGANTGKAGTWTNITPETTGVITPTTTSWDRIKLALAPSDANIVYAFFETHNQNGLGSVQQYNKSANAWTVKNVPSEAFSNGQAWYSIAAAVDPNDPSVLYGGSLDAEKSVDGGVTWTQYTSWEAATTSSNYVHADHHAYVYPPGSSSRLLMGTDGGVFYTTSADVTPSFVNKDNGYDVTQFYSVALHPTNYNYALAGAQDNGSEAFSGAGVGPTTEVTGGDGGYVFIDQTNGNIQVSSYIHDYYFVSTDNGVTFNSLTGDGNGQFINPTDYDPSTKSLYAGRASGDYYRAVGITGTPAYSGVSVSGFNGAYVTAVTLAPITANRLFFGLDNGTVVMVDNAQTGTSQTGVVLTPNGGAAGRVSCIAVDPASENHLLVTYFNYGVTHIFETKNAGAATPTWTAVDGNYPDMPARWALFYPGDATKAVIATEMGVWTTDLLNGSSTTWDPTNTGLANVEVDMLKYRAADHTLAAATQGRGVFTCTLPNTTDAYLTNLTLSTGTLAPAFESGIRSYTASVGSTISTITLTPAFNPGETVTVNGAAVASGSASAPVTLNVGSNIINTIVTATDGVTTQTYSVTIFRGPPSLSYSSPQTYTRGVAITALSPTSTAVAAQAYSNSPVTLGSGFVNPNGVAVDAAGNVYVADVGNNAVKKIPAGGGAVVSLGSGFSSPAGVAVDAAGNVYVADYGNNAVKEIPAGGGAVVSLGSGFNQPFGVAVDAAGNVYVADYGTNAVKKIPAGNGTVVALGSGFKSPSGVAVDAAGNVYVADTGNGVVKEIPVGGGAVVSLGSGFNSPDGVWADAAGNVYVADYGTNAVKEIPAGGGAMITLGLSFNGAAGVCVDAAGNVYVADFNDNTVKEINPVGGYYLSKALPAGLSFNGSNGVISGTPAVTSPATNYTITAYNAVGSTPAAVNIKVIAIATLSKLTISSGTLTPAFATATTSYTDVAHSVSSIAFRATTTDPLATETINGTAVPEGTISPYIPLNAGVNNISVVITAQDGVTKDTYTIAVTRLPEVATLSKLTISSGTLSPAFASGTTSYTDVAHSVSSIAFRATTTDPLATETINGTAVPEGTVSYYVPLTVGVNNISIVVTAQDGVTQDTYTVAVTRLPEVATLSKLTISSGTLTPAFATGTTSYTDVAHAVSSIAFRATTTDPLATETINGTAVPEGTVSYYVPLNAGVNSISIVVTAQDGITTDTYTVAVTRLPEVATLSKLTISNGALSPAFATGTTSYTDVVHAVSSIAFRATTTDPLATETINGTAVPEGTVSPYIPLNVGSNTITIVVTAQDGVTTDTYTITVTRLPEIATLSKLTISSGTLTPAFAAATTSYTDNVANTVSSIAFRATTTDPLATETISGTTVPEGTVSSYFVLNVGLNKIPVIVTAQDGVTTDTYTIAVTRAAPPVADAGYQPISVEIAAGSPQLANDGIVVHMGVSPNGDGIDDFFQIDNITNYPDNRLVIMDRNGTLVYETKGYDNASRVFDGHSNKNGAMQLPGTYFYSLDYTVNGIIKHKTGFLVLKY